MNNYSPNMLKIFEKCPYEFYLKYIQKLNLPQQAKIFEKGKKIHALASYFLKGFEIEKMEKVLNVDEKTAWESLKSNKYFKLEVLGTEYNLSCKVGDFWVGGRLDALVRTLTPYPSPLNGEGNSTNSDFNCYYILDYKTGQIPQNAEYDFQTIIYLLAADKFLQKKGGYKELKFVYLGLKNNIEKEIVLTEELKKAYEEKILAICKEIQIAVKTNKFSKHCKTCDNCEYQKLCKSMFLVDSFFLRKLIASKRESDSEFRPCKRSLLSSAGKRVFLFFAARFFFLRRYQREETG